MASAMTPHGGPIELSEAMQLLYASGSRRAAEWMDGSAGEDLTPPPVTRRRGKRWELAALGLLPVALVGGVLALLALA